MRPAAVFDLDGTLIRGTSAERLLVPYLVHAGVIGARQLAAALAGVVALPLLGATRAVRANKRYLTDVPVTRLAAEMPAFVDRVLEPRLSTTLRSRLESLRSEGYLTLLLTGAPDFIAEAVKVRLGMADALGTRLEVLGGRYTGRLAGPHLFGPGKRHGVEQLVRTHGISLARSVGFADHGSDITFLECFGHAVAVRPRQALRREARLRGWETIEG